MASNDEFAIPTTILRHFDLASAPWTEAASHEIDARREKLPGGKLFYDRLLAFAELDGPSLYPPRTPAAIRRILHAIQTSPPDRLKRDCFLYYLLKDYDAYTKQINGHVEPTMDVDGVDAEDVFASPPSSRTGSKADTFAKRRCMPRTWKGFIDGYWALDHGLWELAVSSLSDPSISEINFVSEILQTLATHVSPPSHACALVNSFLSITHPDLASAADNVIRLVALASAGTLAQAFNFIRARQSVEEQARMREAVWSWALGAPRTPCGSGEHGVQSKALKDMLHLPLTAEEDKHLIDFLSHPPRAISPPALSLLHDLVTLRLIHQGQYQQSLQLDRQLAGSGGKEEDRQRRREMVREFIAILPEAQRRALLVDVEALSKRDEGKAALTNGHAEDVEMGSSWVQVNGPTSQPSVPPPIAMKPAAPSFAAVAATDATTMRPSGSTNSLVNIARVSVQPSTPGAGAGTSRPKDSPFAGPPRFATGTPVASSPRRVTSGSPFNLPSSTAAARAKETPIPLPRLPKQIINDDVDEEEEGSVSGRRVTGGKGKGRAVRELSLARENNRPRADRQDNQEREEDEYRQPPPAASRRSTRRQVSGTSQAGGEKTPPPRPSSPSNKRSARATRQSTAPPTTMPGAFNSPAEVSIDEEMPPPSRPTRASSAMPASSRARSRFTRSASRAILDEETESGPPSKKPKVTATPGGPRRTRRTSVAASDVTDGAASQNQSQMSVRRSTRRGGTAQPSEQGSPTPSISASVKSDAGRRRRTTKEGSMTPRMSTRSRKA